MSLARLIAAQRDEQAIPHAVSCRALGVSPAWFSKWRGGDGSLRRKRRGALVAQVDYLFTQHHRSYGSPRITADLRELGWRVSVNTVAKLMAERGLVAAAHAPAAGPPDRPGPPARQRTCSVGTSPRRPGRTPAGAGT